MLRVCTIFTAGVLMFWSAGCNQGAPSTMEPSAEPEANAVSTGAGNIDSEAKARAFATEHMNDFVTTQTFTDDAGDPITPPKVEVDTWRQVEQKGDRWTLKRGPPGNWYFNAEFNADGSNATFEAQYFAE